MEQESVDKPRYCGIMVGGEVIQLSTKTIEVTVSVAGREVTLKGPEEFVRSEVERLVALSITGSSTTLPAPSAPQGEAKEPRINERELIAQKRPAGHHQIVAVLAFCLAQCGQEEFTEDEMRRAYIRAGVRPPKVVGQALRDARTKYDLIEQGSKRGTYRLSHHGDRTVRFDLPKKDSEQKQ